MSKVGVWIEKPAVKEAVLASSDMAELLSGTAAQIAASCGEGYAYDVKLGRNRYSARVYPATDEAVKDNEKNNTLLRAL